MDWIQLTLESIMDKDQKLRAIEEQLLDLSGNLPKPRNLSEEQLRDLVNSIGPRTCKNIIDAISDFPIARIAFLFSSIDTQAVVDILYYNEKIIWILKQQTKDS